MIRKKKNRKINKGFTLAEVLIVVAITAILSGLSMVGVVQYQRRLKLMEADNAAKDIFLAAQNRLTASWARGEWSKVNDTKTDPYFGSKTGNNDDIAHSITDDDDKDGHEFFYIGNNVGANNNALADILLPFGSIDEKVRSSGTYIIDYDKTTATIYDVYYVDAKVSEATIQLILDNANNIRNNQKTGNKDARISFALSNANLANSDTFGKGFYVGYYGEGLTPLGPDDDFKNPYVIVRNEENLWLEVYDYNADSYDDAELTVYYKGADSGAEVTLKIPKDESNITINYHDTLSKQHIDSSKFVKSIKNGSTRIYYILLDSLTTEDKHGTKPEYGRFFDRFYTFGFIAGEDVTCQAFLSSDKAGVANAGSNVENFNSLFAEITPDESVIGTHVYHAVIKNPRHLQNLTYVMSNVGMANSSFGYTKKDWYECQKSGVTYYKLTGVEIKEDIYWNSYTSTGKGYFNDVKKCPEAPTGFDQSIFANWQNNTTFWERKSEFNKLAVNLNGAFWPIGSANLESWTKMKSVNGFIFDGIKANGKNSTIHNLRMHTGTGDDDMGLISQFRESSAITVKNIDIVNPGACPTGDNFVGSLIGKIQKSGSSGNKKEIVIENCHVYMSDQAHYEAGSFNLANFDVNGTKGEYGIYNYKNSSGGLIGDIEESSVVIIRNSSASVPVVAVADVDERASGGFIGVIRNNANVTINNCYVGGNAEENGDYVDYSSNSINIVCLSSSNKTSLYAGGFIGTVLDKNTARSRIKINNCYSTASVYSDIYSGGFIGNYFNTDSNDYIRNSYALGRIFTKSGNTENNVGSFFGRINIAESALANYRQYCTGNKFLDYSPFESEVSEGVKTFTRDTIATKTAYEQLYDADGYSSAVPYCRNKLPRSYPFIEVPDGAVHYGDWPVPKPSGRSFDGDFGIIYYEIVQHGSYNQGSLDRYYHGWIADSTKADSEANKYIQVDTTSTLGSGGQMVNGILQAPNGNEYVVEDGYLILVDKNTDPNTFGFGLYTYCKFQDAVNSGMIFKYNDILEQLNISGYDAYFINPLNDAINNFILNNESGPGITCQVDIGNNNWTSKAKIFCNPYFGDEISLEPLGTTHVIRGAHTLKMLFETLGGRYIAVGYSGSDTVIQTMDITFDNDEVSFTTCGTTGNQTSVTYLSPTLTASLNGTYSSMQKADGSYYKIKRIYKNPFIISTTANGQLKNLRFEDVEAPYLVGDNHGTIESITLDNAIFKAFESYTGNYGFIGGVNTGTVNNVRLTNIMCSGNGLSESNTGTISNVDIINAQIVGNGFLGNGSTQNGVFNNCHIYGDLEVYNNYKNYPYYKDKGGHFRYHPNDKTKNDFEPKTEGSLYGYNLVTIGLPLDKSKEEVSGNHFGFANTVSGASIDGCSVTGKIYSENIGTGFVNTDGQGTVISNSYSNTLIYVKDGQAAGFAYDSLGSFNSCFFTGILSAEEAYGFIKTQNAYNGQLKNSYCSVWSSSADKNNYYPFIDSETNLEILENCYYHNLVDTNHAENLVGHVVPVDSAGLSEVQVGSFTVVTDTKPYKQFTNGDVYPYPVPVYNGQAMTEYGDWTDSRTNVRVTFDAYGTEAVIDGKDTRVVTYEVPSGSLLKDIPGGYPSATWAKDGKTYELIGWFISPDGLNKNQVDENTLAVETTYYAHWLEVVGTYGSNSLFTAKRNGLYRFEVWGSGENSEKTEGTMYLSEGDAFGITVGTDGKGSAVSASEETASYDSRIMFASGSKETYYNVTNSNDEHRKSFVSGDSISEAISSLSNEKDVLYTGLSIHYSGWVFGNASKEFRSDVETPVGVSENSGYVKVTRLVFSKDDLETDNLPKEVTNGFNGGKDYTIKNNYISELLSGWCYRANLYDKATKDEILNNGTYKAKLKTSFTKIDGKSFNVNKVDSTKENLVTPDSITVNTEDSRIKVISDDYYQFVNTGDIKNNSWNYAAKTKDFTIRIDNNPINSIELHTKYCEIVDKKIYAVKGDAFILDATASRNTGEIIKLSGPDLSWNTSSEGIVTVINGIVDVNNVGTTTLTATLALTDTKNVSSSVDVITTDELSLTVKEGYETKCKEGLTVPLDLKLLFDEGNTLVDLSNEQRKKVKWSSDNEDLAIVDDNGFVTLKSTGKVTITAKYHCNDDTEIIKKIEIDIEELVPETLTLSVNEEKELYELSDKCELDLYIDGDVPLSEEEYAKVSFTIKDSTDSDTDEASIVGNMISFNKIGEYKIAATYKGKQSNTVILKVDGVESISFEKDSFSVDTQTEDFTLKVIQNFLFSEDQEITDLSSLSWSGFDTSVIRVSDGLVQVVGVGETTVTTTMKDGKTASCTVKVREHTDGPVIIFNNVEFADDGYTFSNISLIATDESSTSANVQQIYLKSMDPQGLVKSELVNNNYYQISRLSNEAFTVNLTYAFDNNKQWGIDNKYLSAEGTLTLTFAEKGDDIGDDITVTPGATYKNLQRTGTWEGHRTYTITFVNGDNNLTTPIAVEVPCYGTINSVNVNNSGEGYLTSGGESIILTFNNYNNPIAAKAELSVGYIDVQGSGDFGLGEKPSTTFQTLSLRRGITSSLLSDSESINPSFSYNAADDSSTNLLSNDVKATTSKTVTDTVSLTLYKGQKDAVLPYILMIDGDDKTRLDPADYKWSSSDDSVVSYSYGKLSINGVGEAELTAEIEGNELSVDVTVVENPEISGFYTKGDKYKVEDNEYVTQKWPTVKPSGLTRDTVYVEGNRIIDESGTYYYITQDFEASWNELVGNIGRYTNDKDDDGQYYVVRLPESLFLTSDDFDENGNPLNELHIGDVYTDGDTVYVLVKEEEKRSPVEPTGNSECWEKLKDYDPGADTGPASDALSYPDSIYNPYPGSLNSNCTWAVWYLANVNTGARLPNWGDAGNWFRRAGISGYNTGTKPAKNSILVMDHHVAYVTDVSEDGSQIYVKEGNIQGKYSEGWWTIDSSRLGMKVYGFIYLINDEGETVEAIYVTLEAGRHDTLDEFRAYLEELGLELGDGEEVYDDEVAEGHIVSYRSGEVEKGSMISYKISKGPKPVRVIEIDESYVGKSEEEFVAYLRENGLEPGTITTVEGEEDGIVAYIKTGSYSESDTVDFSVTKKKAEENEGTGSNENEVTDDSVSEILKNTKGMAEDKFLEYLEEKGLKAAEAELVETEDQMLISTIDQAKLGEDGKVHYIVYILKTVNDNIDEVLADPNQIHNNEDEGSSANNDPVDSNKEQSTSNKPDTQNNGNDVAGQSEDASEDETEDIPGEQDQSVEDQASPEEEQPAGNVDDVPGDYSEGE